MRSVQQDADGILSLSPTLFRLVDRKNRTVEETQSSEAIYGRPELRKAGPGRQMPFQSEVPVREATRMALLL